MIDSVHVSHIQYVIDGDSLRGKVEVWPGMYYEGVIRIRGIDTPEVGWRAKCDAERQAAYEAQEILELLVKDRTVALINVEEDKFGGRVLGGVVMVDGLDIAEHLIALGLARAYDGRGAREGWCPADAAV